MRLRHNSGIISVMMYMMETVAIVLTVIEMILHILSLDIMRSLLIDCEY